MICDKPSASCVTFRRKTHLWATKLDVTCVHFLPEHFVDGLRAGQDDRLALDLYDSLAESDKVSADAHGPRRDHRDGKDVIVRPRRLPGNQLRATEAFYT